MEISSVSLDDNKDMFFVTRVEINGRLVSVLYFFLFFFLHSKYIHMSAEGLYFSLDGLFLVLILIGSMKKQVPFLLALLYYTIYCFRSSARVPEVVEVQQKKKKWTSRVN